MRRIKWILMTALSALSLGASAQMEALTPDPAVRTGKLDNGLTYYIRHNELPKDQAEFYIAQRVGSMQEEENQRGLAHFLEHMAFNGTTNFPGKNLLQYLESVGARFGTNVNAYTSFDETVYTLMNIPTTRPGIIDSALLVLYDWSCGIALEGDEIDAERGVIHEEWRTGQGAQRRIYDQVLPILFEGSRYANRMPIGTMEVVDNFSHQEIRDYYKKWYRPDLQGIIVIGDIDVDAVEAKIRAMFGAIELPENAAERIYYTVPDNDAPLVAIARDKELTNVQAMIMYKHDPVPAELRNTPAYFIHSYMSSVMGAMMDSRLEELTQQPEPPFLGAAVYDQPILGVTVTKDALTGVAVTDETGIEKGFRALLTEIRRADRHGFTPSEYERAKADFLQNVETAYNERDKQRSRTYANEYVRAFTEGEPIPGIEAEYALYNQLVPMIPVEAINRYFQQLVSDKNILLWLQAPEKEGVVVPTADELTAMVAQVAASDPEPYVEELSDEPLVPVLPAPGTVVGTSRDDIFEADVWTLSNGAQVIVKPTAYKDDEIRMQAVSPGGWSLIGPEHDNEVGFLNELAALGGLGNFSATDLPKVLAGKNASVRPGIGELSETIYANGSPRDLETMLQLVYLQFTAVRRDEVAFASWRNRMAAQLRNMTSNPAFVYADSLSKTIYDHHPRAGQPTVEQIEGVDYAAALELFRARVADAANYTFIFVGNIDPEVLRPLVEQYIASLPATRADEKAGVPLRTVKRNVVNHFERVVELPKVTMSYVLADIVEPTLENTILMDAMGQVLRSRYTERLREDEGDTYSPQVQAQLTVASHQALVLARVDTNAELYKRLGEIIVEEAMKLAADGPTEVEFQKVREYMLKADLQNRQENIFWMNGLINKYRHGRDLVTGYGDIVRNMTPEQIRDFARRLSNGGNVINVVMNGVAE